MPRLPLAPFARWLGLSLAGTAVAFAVVTSWSLPPAVTGEEPLTVAIPERLDRAASLERPVVDALAAVEQWETAHGYLDGGTPRADLTACEAARVAPSTAQFTACAARSVDLAEWARRLDALRATLPPYRDALGDLDTAEMARTRLLGGTAEDLRPATWPIVEHLKLYPDAERDFGRDLDANPPGRLAADFDVLATWAASAESSPAVPPPPVSPDRADALIRVRAGVLRYAELDLRYGETLRDYDAAVARATATPATPAAWRATAGPIGLALALFLAVGGAVLVGTTSPPVPLSPGRGGRGVRFSLALTACALCLYYLAPNLLLAAVGATGFLAAAWVWPAVGVSLAAVALPFQFHPRPIGGLTFSLAEFAVVACAVSVLARAVLGVASTRRGQTIRDLAGRWATTRRSPFFLPAVLFLAAGILSLVVARGEHFREAARAFRLSVAEPMVLALLVVAVLPPRLVRLTLSLGLVTAALVGAHAIGQYLLGQGVSPMEGVDRVASVYPSATALALYLGRAVPVAAALALLAPSERDRDSSRLAGLGYALLLLPIAGGLLVTWTRGAWLGAWLGVLVVLVAGGRRRLALGWLGLAALGAAALAGSRVERLASLFSLSDGTNVSRLLIWEAALAVLRDHPLTGIGLDQFLYVDRDRYGVPDVRFLLLSHPHNVGLDLWLSLGLPGLVAGVWLAVALIRALWRLARTRADSAPVAGFDDGRRALALGLLGAVVEAVAHGMVDLAYFVPDLALWWWLTIALTEVLRTRPAPPATATEQTGGAAPVRSGP